MRVVASSGREIWLTYCMNVHPGGTVAATRAAIEETVQPLRARLGAEGPFGLGLRLDAATVATLAGDEDACRALADELAERDLHPFTANAFVAGAFHGEPQKERVYAPSWESPERVRYTVDTAEVLVRLARRPGRLSISTCPGSWGGWGRGPEVDRACARHLTDAARHLHALEERTGCHVEVGLEPEPGCTIQTVEEAVAFFAGPLAEALDGAEHLRDHLGLCYDVCHQAVVHEDVGAGLRRLGEAGVRIVKLQASSALEVADPTNAAARRALAAFDEPVYLHQVGARDADGTLHVASDLPEALTGDPAWGGRRPWRVHFHVPVYREILGGGLSTTRAALDEALAAVAAGGVTDHVEIETYTWGVLPDAEPRPALDEALAEEYEYVERTWRQAVEAGR